MGGPRRELSDEVADLPDKRRPPRCERQELRYKSGVWAPRLHVVLGSIRPVKYGGVVARFDTRRRSTRPWSPTISALVYPAAVMIALTCARTAIVFVHAAGESGGELPGRLAIARGFELLLFGLPALPLLAAAIVAIPRAGARRYAWLFAVPLLMSACLTAGLLAAARPLDIVVPYTVTIAVVIVAATYRSAARSATAELMRHEARTTETDAELMRARLRLLQSQLEPHFLFNTLATIQALSRRDRTAAASTLKDLMQYLVDALPSLACAENTLVGEIRLVEAYLRIQSTRMGARFQYDVRLPRSVEQARVPNLLVYGLVDNAIRHGIAPAVAGGTLTVTACRERQALIVQVIDSGRGMTLTEGRSLGLANARHRLALLYGERALLTLNGGSSTGLVATVVLPFLESQGDSGTTGERPPAPKAQRSMLRRSDLRSRVPQEDTNRPSGPDVPPPTRAVAS